MENNGNSGEKSQIGRHGEDLVCRFLMESGHCILERNFRSGHLEIDIITLDRNGIHFVEVKTRRAPVSGNVSDGRIPGQGHGNPVYPGSICPSVFMMADMPARHVSRRGN